MYSNILYIFITLFIYATKVVVLLNKITNRSFYGIDKYYLIISQLIII